MVKGGKGKITKKIVTQYSKRKAPAKGSRYYRTNKIVRLFNKLTLSKAETKESHRIEENNQLYHNIETLKYSLLYTQQGVSDSDTGTSNYIGRVGNEVICRGLSFKFWFANKLDRPNVMYKIIIFKYRADSTIGSAYKTQGSTNFMIRDIDNEKITVLKVLQFNLQVGISNTGAEQGVTNGVRKEAHKYVKCWIPMNNKKLRYKEDNSGSPKYTDIGFSVVPYDSYGTLTTDNIASFAFNVKFYYKDP